MFTIVAELALFAINAWAAFVLAASTLAVLFRDRPFLGVPQHWGLQLWWLSWLGLAPAIWLQAWPALAVCAACALYWSGRIFARDRAARPAAAPMLRLASVNLAYFNRDPDRAWNVLSDCGADVLALAEVTPASRDKFARNAAAHPFAIDTCDFTEKYGILIRSRWPIEVLSRGGGEGDAPRHLHARLQLPRAAVDLIVVHLTNPIRRDIAHRIPGEIAALITLAESGGRDLILCGDCNAAGWSNWLRRLEAATGLANPGRLHPTWPVWLPAPLRLPIDHAWARGRAVVLETRLGPKIGSDHLPLLAEIGWRGK